MSALDRLTTALRGMKSTSPQSPDPYSVGPRGEYSSIQEALDASRENQEPAHIKIHADWDAQAEEYPLQAFPDEDGRWHPTTISGQGPGITTLGHLNGTSDVLQVHGPPGGTQGGYRKPFVLRDVTIQGDSPPEASGSDVSAGLRIAGLPYGQLERVVFTHDGHAGVWRSPYIEMNEGIDASHSFGWRVTNCEVWGSRDAFRLQPGAGAHSTEFTGVIVTGCRGVGLRARQAANVTWRGGVIQLNHSYGIRADDSESLTLRDVYIEGNGRAKDYPVEIYGDGAHGLTVDACYFHGINPRGASHDYTWVQRGVNLHRTQGASIHRNTVRRYGEGFISAMSGSTVDEAQTTIRDETSVLGHVSESATIT